MSVQLGAVASQKFTCPTVTDVVPALTVAVSVTALPEVIVVTVPLVAVMASVVVVCAAAQTFRVPTIPRSEISKRQICLIFN